jgi:hypothetical protein
MDNEQKGIYSNLTYSILSNDKGGLIMYHEFSEEDFQNVYDECEQIMSVLNGKTLLEGQLILSMVIGSILLQMPDPIRERYIKTLMKTSEIWIE